MASVNFLKAVIDIGYMDTIYDENQFIELNQALDFICKELSDFVFGRSEEI